MASSEDLGSTLDVDVVGLVELDFKGESDFFDFDSSEEFGLFGEAGVALHTTATSTSTTTTHTCQPASINNHGACTTGLPSNKKSSHWNAVEKDLFLKGMELFGRNWKRISNFIATKTSGQVRSFHKKWAETANVIQEPEMIDNNYVYLPPDSVCISSGGTEILEDPLGLVETVTTVPLSPRHATDTDSSRVSYIENESGFSSEEMFVPPIGEEWVIKSSDVMSVPLDSVANSHKMSADSKKKYNRKKVKKKRQNSGSRVPFNIKSPKKQKKKKKLKIISDSVSGRDSRPHQRSSPIKESKKVVSVPKVSVPVLEGQVVHLIKDDEEESDVDIDISDDEQLMIVDKSVVGPATEQKIDEIDNSEEHVESETVVNNVTRELETERKKQQVLSFPPPTQELEFDTHEVTEEERKVHFEYFDGKGVKTPERYLKIRNYIISCWKQVKPSYMRKTAVRGGLKNCGDVNAIGKVHEYLEKVGAINFGCHESNYDAPLIVGTRNKEKLSVPSKTITKVDRSEMIRHKQKKKWEVPLSEGGGLTISHDESGAVVDACHVPEAPRNRAGIRTGRNGEKAEQFKLIRCLDYDVGAPVPFCVVMHPHALITLDLHAHTSRAEVMGLLGGYHDPSARTLHVTVAVPTRAVSSGVECDMCPVSQSAACIAIHEGGVQVVGWYHSHPTFPPNPSVQDIDTQSQMQRWFACQDAPFLGIIVSPFCPTNRTEASQIRCIILDKPPHGTSGGEEEGELTRTPYKLNWSVSDIVPGAWEEVNQGVRQVIGSALGDAMAVEWRGEWRGQVTNWEKAISSLHHHLPLSMKELLLSVRTTFLAAVKEYLDSIE